MKKIRLENFSDLKEVIAILECHGIDFTWDFFNQKYELFLGHSNVDHVKLALEGAHFPYKILDYYS